MRIVLTATLGLCLAIAGCSKPTQEKTSADLKAAGAEMGAAVKDVAATPAMKAVGSDIKQGAAEAGQKTKEAAGKAGEKLKEAGGELSAGAKKAGSDLKTGADKAADKVDEAAKN
jgi:colicin import membrane protein